MNDSVGEPQHPRWCRSASFAALLVIGAPPVEAGLDVPAAPPTPLPGWVQTATQWIDWVSSLFPSGGASSIVSNVLFAVFGAIVVTIVPAIRRAFARRSERIASDPALRKLETRKQNEHIRLFGTLCNTLGAAVIGASFIVPYIQNRASPDADQTWWLPVGVVILTLGHVAVRFMKGED